MLNKTARLLLAMVVMRLAAVCVLVLRHSYVNLAQKCCVAVIRVENQFHLAFADDIFQSVGLLKAVDTY